MAFRMSSIVFASCLTVGLGRTFRGAQETKIRDATGSLTDELTAEDAAEGAAHERVLEFEEAFADTFAALPKNHLGQLDHPTVRYILHRLFVHRHGWYFKGLEPGGDIWSADPQEGKANDWVPSYMIDEMETRLKGGGIDLHGLAALGAALEDVARKEVVGTMKNVYTNINVEVGHNLTSAQVDEAIDNYMVFFLGDGKWALEPGIVEDFKDKHAYFAPTREWYRGFEKTYVTKSDGSPDNAVGFAKVVKIAQDLGAQYSSYNDLECSKLKSAMLGVWSQAASTGRITLSDFYKLGQDSEWALNEKIDYLRTLGALDESNPDMPMVIVPNYLTARPNCLQSTRLYSVCCRNECEGLMSQLEHNISAPSASVDRIAAVVGTLASTTVAAPWLLTQEMRERLVDIATLHGGEVYIHGRLFAQWMHHAFPSECPYPHEAGTSNPVTPDEWMHLDTEASEEEIKEQTEGGVLLESAGDIVLPWTQKEELLGAKYINLTDARTSLAFELSGESKVRLQDFREALQPFWASLPKDDDGFLEHQTARYVLHRLFVKRHSWNIKGLEPNGDVWHTNSTTDESLKDWVPGFLLELMQERLGRRGLDLSDLAALGAAIEDLVHKEAEGTLGEVYRALGIEGEEDRPWIHKAISAYMVVYLGNGAWSLQAALTNEFAEKHSYWPATERWFSEIESEVLGIAERADFQSAVKIAHEVGARYGGYNDEECRGLKAALLSAWGKGKATGRVRLVDFYRLGMDSEWSLSEKASYLRVIGALDESNASSPMVIIPNYLTSQPNCVQATSLYAICCPNQCENLLSEMERGIAAPTATPERIVSLVSNLGSDTVQAPRDLPRKLVDRLEGIAVAHGGEVNLHGRLFAQWMHHAFPSECPYPHEAGTSNPVTPDEWIGEDIEATEEERKRHVDSDDCGPQQAADEWVVELPWSHTEELLSQTAAMKVQLASASAGASASTAEAEDLFSAQYAALALAAVALGVALTLRVVRQEERQKCIAFLRYNSRGVLVATLLLVAFAANLVNRVMIVLLMACGLAVRCMSPPCAETLRALEKQKACV